MQTSPATAQTRKPAALVRAQKDRSGVLQGSAAVTLSTENREDTGHSIVHSPPMPSFTLIPGRPRDIGGFGVRRSLPAAQRLPE